MTRKPKATVQRNLYVETYIGITHDQVRQVLRNYEESGDTVVSAARYRNAEWDVVVRRFPREGDFDFVPPKARRPPLDS